MSERRARGARPGQSVLRAALALAAVAGLLGALAWTACARAPAPLPPRPNILLVLVDTLRADHLPSYGYGRPTAPNVEALLARRGTVVERAYAPAPWTIPSVIALHTGRRPWEVLPEDPAAFRMPAGEPTLATALRARGYQTAGFTANPTLPAQLGFAAGFDHYECAPGVVEALAHGHADRLTEQVRAWARHRDARPFFVYAHYLDPHDPYDDADIAGNHSLFDRTYAGSITGADVHGVFLGKVPLRDPAADVAHLVALYDTEVHYFDRFLPRLLAAFDARTLRHTLVLLVADHGEELHDHGGWKHGRTLYEEQLRVPFVARWDEAIPAGRRLPGPVTLLDVAPTLLAAAGGGAPASWQGRDLLPLLSGRGPAPPPQPLEAQQLADGPMRGAVVARGWKLVLFDRAARFQPQNELESILYAQEMRRLRRVELYDLAHDAHERRDVAAARPDLVAALAPLVEEPMARHLAGLRVMLAGAPAGAAVDVEMTLPARTDAWRSWWLGESDRVVVDGSRVRLRLVGEALPKGIALPAGVAPSALRLLAGSVAVRYAGGAAYDGGAVSLATATRDGWPAVDDRPTLWLWVPRAHTRSGARDAESLRRLRALGYAG